MRWAFIYVAGTTIGSPVPPKGGELATFPLKSAGRSDHALYKCSAFLTFYLVLTLHRRGSIWKFFMINNFPGTFTFRIYSPTLVVSIQSFVQILSRAYIIGTIFETLYYVNEIGHRGVLRLEQRPVNKKAHLQ